MKEVTIHNLDIKLVVLEVTSFCNLNCIHCFNRPNSTNQHMSLYDIKKILKELNEFNIPQIWISGGEPLCHPKIKQIIDLAGDYPNIEFCFTTNGTLINEDVITQMEQYSNISIQVSVDGPNDNIHDSYRGQGSFKKLLYALDLIKESSIKKKMARICVSLLNYLNIPEIYELCLSKNIIPSFLFVENIGNAKINQKNLELSLLQKIFVINELKKMNKKLGMNVDINRPPKGCPLTKDHPLRSFFIKSNGDISCCQPFYDYSFANIFTSSVLDYYNSLEMKKLHMIAKQRHELLDQNNRCITCDVRVYCDYGCPGYAFLKKDIMNIDYLCDMRKALVFALGKGLIPEDIEYKEVKLNELEKTGYRIN